MIDTKFNSRDTLLRLLNARRDTRYRAGVLHYAVLSGVINHQEYLAMAELYLANRRAAGATTFSEATR